jgi:ArsR family transcriptional regulator
MNMKNETVENQIAGVLKVLGSPFRLNLLYTIGHGEACVCHLETILKKRQAYISQHLMVLRDAGILETRRDGKYIFYRIADQNIFNLIKTVAVMQKIPVDDLPDIAKPGAYTDCPCPNCETVQDK